MHKKHRAIHSRKKDLALALCVSLWMAGGSAEAAAEHSLSLNPADDNKLYYDGAQAGEDAITTIKTSTGVTEINANPAGKTLTVTGGDWKNDYWYIRGGYAENGDDPLTGYHVTGQDVWNFTSITGARTTSGNVSGNHVTLTGGGTKEYILGSIGGGVTKNGNATGNTVTLTNVKLWGDAHSRAWYGGGYIVTPSDSAKKYLVTGNSFTMNGGSVFGYVFGGMLSSSNSLTHTQNAVNGNQVTLNGATVTTGVVGGWLLHNSRHRIDGSAINNTVTLHTATVNGYVYGGFRTGTTNFPTTSDLVTGNTLNLSGQNTVNSVSFKDIITSTLLNDVQNFETINIVNWENKISDTETEIVPAEWGKPVLTLNGASILENDTTVGTLKKAKIDASTLQFAKPETIANGTTMDLIKCTGTGTITAALAQDAEGKSTTALQEYNLTPVTGLLVNAAFQGQLSIPDDKKALVCTASNKANKLTFGVVEWKDSGALFDRAATLPKVRFAGADVDTSNISFTNVSELGANRTMTLVSNFGDSVGTITGTKYKVGTAFEGEGKASLTDSNGDGVKDALIFTTAKKDEGNGGGENDGGGNGGGLVTREQTHNTVMGAAVGMAALSMGNDFIGMATAGLGLDANAGADGVSSFAQMGGGSMRQETGSHVDSHTWNAILGLGHKNKKERSIFEYGAFFEYGTDNYTTQSDEGRGDGSARYTGGGLLAKWQKADGLYLEGSLRAGTVHDDARDVLHDGAGVGYGYNTDAGYWGAHIGVGKEIEVAGGNVVDVYGKYFYNRRNSVSFDVAAADHYDLDAVTSQVLRVGARYTMKRDKWSYYGGLAYEHELDGKANGTASNGGVSAAIRGADTSGASFRGEIGATMKPGENSPWSLDLNVAGFAGKKQGVTGGVSVSFMF